jgi:CBS domain-containing protein
MNIASLCSREVVGIAAEASVREAAILMCKEHVGSLVVMTSEDPPQVVGILTDRDLALDVLGREPVSSGLRAGSLAKSPPVAVEATASLQEAVAAMEKAGVRRLLVVDADGGVVGLVSAEDVMAAISAELVTLVNALYGGIKRERNERRVTSQPTAVRPVYPNFGTAMQ